jgi:DNA-binding MarR family transcriptional regulator
MAINPDTVQFFKSKLRLVGQRIGNRFKNEIVCCGVSLAQCHVLIELDQQCCCSLKALAEALGLDISTLSRTVDTLVKEGYVKREENPSDRRSINLTLSEKGREKTNYINTKSDEYYKEVLELIPAEKHALVIETMEWLGRAMAEFNPEPAGERE